jgi:poly(A) polymerase
MGGNGGNARQSGCAAGMTILPDAPWRKRTGLDALIAALGDGDMVRFVGGAVRDTLLMTAVSDIDIATRLTPPDVITHLKRAAIKSVPTGIAHGTITAVTAGGPVEITTLRRDVSTDGRRATISFTDDWREDAARRDFTINALFANPVTGAVYDYFDGIADLAAGLVRFIGDPQHRIAEDHLRILRFFRFHARFGRGVPDDAGFAACVARANDLMALSRERIADELLKLLGGIAPVATVRLMLTGGILKPVLPEIVSAAQLEHLVAREHMFGFDANPIRRLAALIGPRPDAAASIAARLRFSRAQTRRLTAACGTYPAQSAAALAYRLGHDSAIDHLLIENGDPNALQHWRKPSLPISGGGLIARGLAAGPIVAETLSRIENAWIAADFPSGEAFDEIVSAALT